MKALLIVSMIAAILWLIGMISANVIIEYSDSFKLTVRVLFIRIRIIPKKKKKPGTSAFTAEGYRKKLIKLEQKRLKKEQKKAKKQANKDKKEQEKNKDGQKSKEEEKRDIPNTVGLITDVVGGLLRSFGKHLRIKSKRLRITVASGDAAATAVLYGSISQALSYLIELLNRVTDFRYDPDEFSLDVDFLSEKPKADVLLVFRLRVWHVFAMLGRTAISYLKSGHRNKTPKHKFGKKENTDNANIKDVTSDEGKEAQEDGRK